MTATICYDASGTPTGVRIGETTHSMAALALLTVEAQTARNEAAERRAQVARLEEMIAAQAAEIARLREAMEHVRDVSDSDAIRFFICAVLVAQEVRP